MSARRPVQLNAYAQRLAALGLPRYDPQMPRTLPSRTTSINAVHEEQTRALLEELGVAGSYDDGTLRCVICHEPVRELGLGVARRVDDEVVFSCARLDCMRALS